jgi:hypothetical protein
MVTAAEVEAAIRQLFPGGTGSRSGEVIRSVFLFIKRQDRADNVG